MAHHVEPMDVDNIESDFDNKENTFHNSNVLLSTEKGYEELDVSELNMKLRYSITPNSSPMSKSYTANCLDNRTFDLDNDNLNSNENGNLTRSLNLSVNKNENNKPFKTLPLQSLSTEQFVDNNRNTSVLRQLDTTLTESNNVTVTVTGADDIDENISFPSSSSSATHTPEATTPTKEIPRQESGSPIMRGLKSVLNMFRPSQSPIPPADGESNVKPEILSPAEVITPKEDNASARTKPVLASTPIAASKNKDPNTCKRSSPHKDSIVFNDDLEKELQWKDETTILFSEEKIPLHKLLFQSSKAAIETKGLEIKSNQNVENSNTTLEYMDITYNESLVKDKTIDTQSAPKLNESNTAPESDSEFLDCETTLNNNASHIKDDQVSENVEHADNENGNELKQDNINDCENTSAIDEPLKLNVTEVFINIPESTQSLDLLNQSVEVNITSTPQNTTHTVSETGVSNDLPDARIEPREEENKSSTVLPDLLEVNKSTDVKPEDTCSSDEPEQNLDIKLENGLVEMLSNNPQILLPTFIENQNINNHEINANSVTLSVQPEDQSVVSNIDEFIKSNVNTTQDAVLCSTFIKNDTENNNVNSNVTQNIVPDSTFTQSVIETRSSIEGISQPNVSVDLDKNSTFTTNNIGVSNVGEFIKSNLDLTQEMGSNVTFVENAVDTLHNTNEIIENELHAVTGSSNNVDENISKVMGSSFIHEKSIHENEQTNNMSKSNLTQDLTTNTTFVKDTVEINNINDVSRSALDLTRELLSNATFVANADDLTSNINLIENKTDMTHDLVANSTFVEDIADKTITHDEIIKLSNLVVNENTSQVDCCNTTETLLTDIPADIPLPDEDDIDKELNEPTEVLLQNPLVAENLTSSVIINSASVGKDINTQSATDTHFEAKSNENILTATEDKMEVAENVDHTTYINVNDTQKSLEFGHSSTVEEQTELSNNTQLMVEPMDINESIVDLYEPDDNKTIPNVEEVQEVVNEAITISEKVPNHNEMEMKSDPINPIQITPVLLTESNVVTVNSIPDVVPEAEDIKMTPANPIVPQTPCEQVISTPNELLSCHDQNTSNKEELKQILEGIKDDVVALTNRDDESEKEAALEKEVHIDTTKKNDMKVNDIVKAVEEEIIVSENNSPYVSLSADIGDIPDVNQTENFEEIDNPFKTNNKIATSPPLSPKIVSKGYNFNFDEIDDPFATKTKVRMSPPPTTSANQSFENANNYQSIKKSDVPNKVADKNRRKSQPEKRKTAPKRNFNATFDGKLNVKQTDKPIEPIESNLPTNFNNVEKDKTDNKPTSQSIAMEVDHTSKSNESSNPIETIEVKDVIEEKSVPLLSKAIIESPNDNNVEIIPSPDLIKQSSSEKLKTTSSSEQSFYSAGTSSSDGVCTKNIFNLPEINDINFNPFATKSKVRVSPPPSLEPDNPFATKSKIKSSPNTSIVVERNIEPSVVNTTVAVESPNRNVSPAIPDKKHLETPDKDSSVNISSTTCSSKTTDDKDCTVREVHTEDEDTEEGPFLETEEFKNVDKILEFGNDNVDMLQFNELSPQENEDNAEGELFIDAEAFEFLLNQNKSNTVAESGKESLFLKFDPLFAKRISSDGVLAALNKVQKRQSTPKKTVPEQYETLAAESSPIPGPSTLNMTHDVEVNSTVLENNEDFNITVSKPMMVVTPAVNPVVTPRTKSTTPTRTNRRSITFTSPAMAVIDRLLSLSGNNSLVGHETTVAQVSREQHEAELALTQLRELLAEKEIHVYNLRSESKELKDRLSTMETQMKSLEAEGEQRLKNINKLNERLAEKTKMNRSMAVVVEEYERTIASLIAETEQDKKRHAEERIKLIKERDEQTAHLASMEVSFSDLHSKYEKSKQIILACKANEDAYKKSIKEFGDNLTKMQTNYELLKQHATSKLNHANQELEKMNRAHEAEVVKLNAMIKRKDLHITSLEETLAQKTKANEELTAICDELINKVG